MVQVAAPPRGAKPDTGVGSGSGGTASAPAPSGVEKPAHDVVAGAMARAASQSTIHPLDTMKVRMQACGAKGKGGAAAAPAAGLSQSSAAASQLGRPPSSSSSSSSINSLQRGLTEVASLYKGVVSAATGAGCIIGAYFAFYSTTKRFLRERTRWSDGHIAFVSGATAAVGSGVVKVPIAVCIRSVQAGVYPDVFAAAHSITKAAGVRGLFTGYVPTLMEDVPDMAVKFAVYETLRITHRGLRDREPNTLEDLFMGGAAGAAAAAATTPLDVIKTRMMCSASSRPTLGGAVRSVLAEGEGARGFFRGVGPRALSNGLNSAVFFCFFEAIRRVLIQHHAEAAAASPQGRAAEQQQQQQQQQQGARQHRQQQPVLALSAAGASSASSIHVGGSSSSGSRRGTQQQQAPAGASSSGGGSGRLACLSLALPIAEWR